MKYLVLPLVVLNVLASYTRGQAVDSTAALMPGVARPIASSEENGESKSVSATPKTNAAEPPEQDVPLKPRRYSLGVGWPVVLLRGNVYRDIDVEARVASWDSITAYALRGYWTFLKYDHLSLYAGGEAGFFNFDSNIYGYQGSGLEAQPFVGVEVPIWKYLSANLDFGPTGINIKSGDTSQTSMEWVFNSGLYYRFF